MNPSIVLHATACAICGTPGNAREVYTANFDEAAFNPAVFSARRLPDRLHYRMVRCRTCGLLRSDPVAASEILESLYARSDQNYEPEIANIRLSYGRYLDRLDRSDADREALLEIGCGSGFFLEEARSRGYREAWGVEPSATAASQASPSLHGRIIQDVLRPGLLPDGKFDVICMFQVFDHLPDPNSSLDVCFKLLKPGGEILALNHDAGSISARILGEQSPIIDIEHTYLYDRDSMGAIFRKHGFEVLRIGTAVNHYSLQYLAQLIPLPRGAKSGLMDLLRKTGVGRIGLTIGLGNLFLIGRKPLSTAGA